MREVCQQMTLRIVELETVNKVGDQRVVAVDDFGMVKLEWIHRRNAFVENELIMNQRIDFGGFEYESCNQWANPEEES